MYCPQFALNLEVELNNDPGKFGGSATNRKCTDVFALIIVVLFFGAVIGLTIYCILNIDIDKLRNGYDDSGNICGKNNIKPDSMQFEGFGKNMEEKKYVLIKQDGALGKTKECVENCTMRDFTLVSNFCVSDERFIPYFINILQYWKYVIIAWFVCIIFSLLTSKFYIKFFYVIPQTYIACTNLLLILVTIIFWSITIYFYCVSDNFFKPFMYSSIALSIIYIFQTIFLIQVMYKSMFAAQLIKETAQVMFAMPLLFVQPFFSSFIFSSVLVLVIYFWFLLQTFSHLEQIGVGPLNETIAEYVPYPIATVTGALLIYGFILFYEILKNWQCMVVGGCAAQWYFTRRSGGVSQPIKRTVLNLLKYHLGTICFGSLILPPIYVVRSVVNAIKGAASGNNRESVYTCSCRLLSETCLATFTTTLDCFSQNGFVLTAMYGCTFCAGTTRANKLIFHNNFNAAALNKYVDFVLLLTKVVIFAATIIIGFILIHFEAHVKYKWIILISYMIVCFLMVEFFVSVIEVMIDTFLLCFCEDVLYKSGASKPYYMSTDFAQFVENANKQLDPVKWKEVADRWQKGPRQEYSHENFFETQGNVFRNAFPQYAI